MNLIHAGRKFIFHLTRNEMSWLRTVLDRYPLIPPAHQSLSKSAPDRANQRLLDDALAEHRAENRRQLQALLESEKHIREIKAGFRLGVSPAEIEWLLQVLNDVRVGAWILLGSPDGDTRPFLENKETAPLALLMILAGDFQHGFLNAFRQSP